MNPGRARFQENEFRTRVQRVLEARRVVVAIPLAGDDLFSQYHAFGCLLLLRDLAEGLAQEAQQEAPPQRDDDGSRGSVPA